MKSFLKFLRDVLLFTTGAAWYVATGKNTTSAYYAMIRLFCATKGRSNDFFAKVISVFSAKLKTEKSSGALGTVERDEIRKIVTQLNENGYYVLPTTLSDEMCEKLHRFAANTKAKIRHSDEQLLEGSSEIKIDFYNSNAPAGVRYDYQTTDLLNDATVQALFSDPGIIAIASEYLNTVPILDIVAMWWHTSYSDRPDSNAAQLYHFDMDRIKWLKFFFYLTDVTEENGPHCFVAKSHKTGRIPNQLLKKGYARNTDEEVQSYFPKEDFIEFVAPKGTIIIEDTRGLHKGKHVLRGDRLIFQLEYAASMFGTVDGKMPPLRAGAIEKLIKMNIEKYQIIFQNILPKKSGPN